MYYFSFCTLFESALPVDNCGDITVVSASFVDDPLTVGTAISNSRVNYRVFLHQMNIGKDAWNKIKYLRLPGSKAYLQLNFGYRFDWHLFLRRSKAWSQYYPCLLLACHIWAIPCILISQFSNPSSNRELSVPHNHGVASWRGQMHFQWFCLQAASIFALKIGTIVIKSSLR